jgi:anti-anti-sigma factor
MAAEPLAFTPKLRAERTSRFPERRTHPAGSHAEGTDVHSTSRFASVPAPAPSLIIVIGRALGTVVVTLRGDLTEQDAPTLKGVLADLINNQGNLDVVIHMRHLAASSSGLRALVAAAEWAAERGASFRLSEPVPALHQKLEGVGLASLVELGAHQTLHARS